jgi:predicted nuclease of predicted toxin-antitoxin system
MPELHRLYLDQMFGRSVAVALRGAGHDVIRAEEYGQTRADDQEILQKAIADNRILVTLDEHFGDWVVLRKRKHRIPSCLEADASAACFQRRAHARRRSV